MTSPIEPAPIEPVPIEPAMAEPAPPEPAPIEPAPIEPALTALAPTGPAMAEPATIEPAKIEPAPIEPAPTELAPTELAPTELAPTGPAMAEPATIEPAKIEPAPTEPAPNEPAPNEPALTELAPTGRAETASPSRSTDLALARVHLRLGSLALARTELETLAGLEALDPSGQVDLAEARWRTGDLTGAGAAARAALQRTADEPVALVIAAEAAAADGRPSEARRLASSAIESVGPGLDALFAGMSRAGIWPADAAEPPPTAGTLFHKEPGDVPGTPSTVDDRAGGSPRPPDGADAAGRGDRVAVEPGAAEKRAVAAHAALTLGFWGAGRDADPATLDLPDPADAFDAGRTAFVAGEVDEAALRFGLALRLAPAFAPAVLDATEGARSAGLIVVRGDAYRLVGHEAEAQQAYSIAAAGGLPERRKKRRSPPTPLEPQTLNAPVPEDPPEDPPD